MQFILKRVLVVVWIKRIIISVVLISELILFGYFFVYGSHGVQSLNILKKTHQKSQRATQEMNNQIKELQALMQEWTEEPFLIEQTAREKLQMACPDDTVYFI